MKATRDDTLTATKAAPLQPLTERILSFLPRPAAAWIALWVGLVAVRPLLFSQVLYVIGGEQIVVREFVLERTPVHLVLAYMAALSFWGVRKFFREARALDPALADLTEASPDSELGSPFHGMESVRGPLLLTAAVTIEDMVVLAMNYGWRVSVVAVPILVLPVLPLMTLFWTYIMLLIGLDRLGRRHLALDLFPQDTGLGLRPVGSLAATGFWVFVGGSVPFLLISLRRPTDLVLGLTFFLAGVFVFFLSLARLHRQMAEAKRRYVARARDLYAQAFAPVRPLWTLEALHDRSPLLKVAEDLERRANAIQEWPFDERTNSRIFAVAMGVTIATIARLVSRGFGL